VFDTDISAHSQHVPLVMGSYLVSTMSLNVPRACCHSIVLFHSCLATIYGTYSSLSAIPLLRPRSGCCISPVHATIQHIDSEALRHDQGNGQQKGMYDANLSHIVEHGSDDILASCVRLFIVAVLFDTSLFTQVECRAVLYVPYLPWLPLE
jgi:hypothetical protein